MDPQAAKRLDETSPSVQAHLSIIQNVIDRMGSNSASCKTWCITIVAAILVIVADNREPTLVLLAVLPTLVFAGLDAYYLALEQGFRNSYNKFIKKLHVNMLTPSDLYSVAPTGGSIWKSLLSPSIWGFYLPLLALAAAAIWAIACA